MAFNIILINKGTVGSILIISFGREKLGFEVVFDVVFCLCISIETSCYWHVPNGFP